MLFCTSLHLMLDILIGQVKNKTSMKMFRLYRLTSVRDEIKEDT